LALRSEGGEESMLALYGRAFGSETVPAPFRTRPPLATPAGRLPSFLPQLGLALWNFPDDPGILGLADVWRRGGVLFDQAGVLLHTPWSERRPGLETVLVSYVPAKRCILRYERLDHARPEPFYGKVYGAQDATVLFAQMQALWDHARTRAPELVLARPLGCAASLNALWQSSPGGEPLLEALDSIDLVMVLRRVAAALAALHRCDLRPARVWRVQEESMKLRRAQAALGRFYPMLQPRIDAVLERLQATAPGEAPRLVPVHGDFHCNQVLVDADRVAVIDFDLFGMGDPLHDLARFLSRFRVYAHGKLSAALISQGQASFLSTYEILVPWRVDRRRLGWLMAALLVNRQVLKAVKRLSGGGSQPVERLLEEAAVLASGRGLQ
jgi:aminoglycoside phosphotransferase